MVNLPWQNPRFSNSFGVLKTADNPLNTINALDDLWLHGRWKVLRWFLNMFEKIVAKHLNKSPKLHTARRRHLREFIRCKRPQFLQSDD
ncbi:hypothetical protein TNCV_1799271 [Trichonephila clavipes]|uniref:Uncharacterized protein n=1 Tax=Trichonephila clavipes TaxID=2585209 RepID=A0A8X6SJC6_TRICX|nr:hypothetical protein TNCV_1799271 [Trichonephila clavipes]